MSSDSPSVISDFGPALKVVWWVPLLRGVVLIVLGLLVMIEPLNTLTALTWIFGLFLLVDAVIVVGQGWLHRSQDGWKLWLFQGAVDAAFAVLLRLWPSLTVAVFFYLLTIWTIVLGVVSIIGAAVLAKNKDLGWPWLLVFGLLSFMFGVMLLLRGAKDFSEALEIVGLIIGIYAFIGGSVQIVAAFSVRSVAKEISQALTPNATSHD
ncbi:HdeD family acid-resistance protein [Timonella sp. A28]|uniref:HdeD family acid-resistance protein n=1 Tax=Timonella sp. A28 TaxID=3442640 RepID=UPI003EB875F1